MRRRGLGGRVFVLVVAAGRGVRFGGPTPKQWLDCAGTPLLSHTLEAIAAASGLAGIIVVVHPDDRAALRSGARRARPPPPAC